MRLPLRVSGPILLALPVLIVALALVALAAGQSLATVRQLTQRNLEQLHARVVDHIDGLLRQPVQAVRLNVGLMKDGRLDPHDMRSWADPLYDHAVAAPRLSSISWERSDGGVVWMARYPGEPGIVFGVRDDATGDSVLEYRYLAGGELEAESFRGFEYDPRDWAPYQTAQKSAAPAWVGPVEWVDDAGNTAAWAIAYVEPWNEADGTFTGAVTAQLTLDQISEFLAKLPTSHRSFAYVMDVDGRLLADSSRMNSDSGRLELRKAWDSPVPLIAESSSNLRSTRDRIRAVVESDGARPIDINGEPYFMRISPLTRESGLDWVVVTLVPVDEYMSGIRQATRLSLVIAFAAVAMTFLLGVFIAMRMIRPTVELSNHVRRIGQGDFDSRINLTLSTEFVEMSSAINQMSADLKDRLRMQQSLVLAKDVQQHLLPPEIPKIAGVQLAAHSTYCDETGGDYYDFLPARDGEIGVTIAVGDVMGHGVPAAMLMATARGILRSRCEQPAALGQLLGHLNDQLCEVTASSRFMTMMLLTLSTSPYKLTWASAGHGTPLIFDPDLRDFVNVQGGGIPLGVDADVPYDDYVFASLRPGMIILAATDGLWESPSAENAREYFGMDRVRDVLHEHAGSSANGIAMALHDALRDFIGYRGQVDDITYVIARLVEAEPDDA